MKEFEKEQLWERLKADYPDITWLLREWRRVFHSEKPPTITIKGKQECPKIDNK